MTTENLGDVFGRSAVGGGPSGLAGRLPRVGARPATTPPAAPVAAPVAAPIAEPVAVPVAPAVADDLTSDDTSTRQLTAYVLPHVPEAIRAAKAGRTNAAVVYDAIEDCQRQLPQLLAARRTPPPSGGLFVRHPTDARDQTRVPWTFKATPANRTVLDQLAARFGAESRSELVATALEAAYPPPPAGERPAGTQGARSGVR